MLGEPRPPGSGSTAWRIEFEGVVNQLYRRFKTTGSEAMRRYYMRYFRTSPATTCGGERLRPESRAVKLRGRGIVELSRLTIQEAHGWLRGAGAQGQRGEDRRTSS